MKKLLMILASGFEELEATAVADVMCRCGIEVVVAGLEDIDVTGSHGLKFRTDRLLAECPAAEFAGVYLPGGMPGAVNLLNSAAVIDRLKDVAAAGGVTAAICAAPIVLARAGLLSGRRFTMYPGFESYLGGLTPTGNLSEQDGNVVTGRGPGAVFAFAARLAERLEVGSRVAAVFDGMFVPEEAR